MSHLSQNTSSADSQGPDPCIRLHCLMWEQSCELAGYCDSALLAAASHQFYSAQAWCKRQDHCASAQAHAGRLLSTHSQICHWGSLRLDKGIATQMKPA